MSLGMGADVRAADPDRRAPRAAREDSGIGSGVLNTMQQVGGALGLATLTTVARALHQTAAPPSSAARWPRGRSRRGVPGEPSTAVAGSSSAAYLGAFTEGATARVPRRRRR